MAKKKLKMPVETKHPGLPELPIEQWLSPQQLAAHFGLSDGRANGWLRKGYIPPAYIKQIGKNRFKFHPSVIPVLEEVFAASHLKRAADRSQPARAGAAE